MVRGIQIAFLLFFPLAACGGGTPVIDAGPTDAGADAAGLDASLDGDAGFDGAMDAGAPCDTDSDCHDPANPACLRGHCAPGVCFSSDPAAYGCPSGFDCISSRCVPPACGECPSGEVCAPATHGCVAPVDAVACRAAGGLYVRGRCLNSDMVDAPCDGGFVSETVPQSCNAPTVAGANLGAPNIVRVGPFPVAKVESPVAGSLSGRRVGEDDHFLWRFAYVDPSVAGGAAEATLELRPAWEDPRGPSCITPASSVPLCGLMPSDSSFVCGGLAIEALAGDRGSSLALAGQDDAGRLAVDWIEPEGGALVLRNTYVSPEPSGVWPPLLVRGGHAAFRVGAAEPLTLVYLDRLGESPVDARLASGLELAWGYAVDGVVALDVDHALVTVRGGGVQPLLTEDVPVGPYSSTLGTLGALVAHASLPLPSTLRVYRRGSVPAPGEPQPVILVAEEPNVGLAVDTHLARHATVVGAVPLDSGGWGLDEIVFPDSGPSVHRPLIRPEDVGGMIVAVTDLSAGGDGDPCVDLTVLSETLVGAMLDIRLADGSVVHELWAVAIKGW